MPVDVFARTIANTTLKGLPTGPMLGVDKTGLTDETVAINAAIANQGMVEFPAYPTAGRYGVTGGLSIARSNVHLRFQNGAALIPVGTAPGQMIDIRGSAPSSWVSLSANAYQHACVIQTASDPGWQVGDWLEIRSNKIIDSTPNYCSDAVGDCHKIAQKMGSGPFYWVFKEPICEDFLVADSAVAGKATMLENIVIENPQFNDENFASTIGFSIRAQYCYGLKIIRPKGYGSKFPFAADSPTGDFIKMINCIEPYIEDPCMTHGAYYGLTIAGWTRGLKSYGGTMTDVRHAVSLVQVTQSVIGTPGRIQQYGQPIDTLIHGMTARNTTLSSFDTHDTGLNVRFESCTAFAAGDDGFQFRTPKVKARDCVSYGALNDGFSHNDLTGTSTGAADCELINCRALNNGRAGVNFRYNRGVIRGGEYSNNGSTRSRPALIYPPTSPPAAQGSVAAGACGIRINGGIIDGATIQGNAGTGGVNGNAIIYGDTTSPVTMRPLAVCGVTAPASAVQTTFMSVGGAGLDFGLVSLGGGNQIDGYGNNLFNNVGTITNKPPVSLGGNHITTDASQRRGQATLVGGTAFVANTAVRNKAAAAFSEAIVSKIALSRMTAAGIPGSLYVKSINDQVGFTIASTNFVEPTRTNVIRNNTNVGAVNGALPTPGVLPTNWSINALFGLTVTVVGTGTETGPGGGTQNYIDVRLSGTATAANNALLAFDTTTNTAAATAAGQTWTASFGIKLTAGSMTGISPLILLSSYSAGGASLVDNLFTAISVTATGVRQTRTGTLTGAAAFARAALQMTVANGVTIDATVRIYMPQVEQAADGSAPIATSAGAATRTADVTNTDNSTIEWVHSI